MSSNSKPKIDAKLFASAIKDAPKAPVQKTVPVNTIETNSQKEDEVVLVSMYFKIDKRLKKDLTVFLANEDLYIQQYLHDLIMNDLKDKDALKSM